MEIVDVYIGKENRDKKRRMYFRVGSYHINTNTLCVPFFDVTTVVEERCRWERNRLFPPPSNDEVCYVYYIEYVFIVLMYVYDLQQNVSAKKKGSRSTVLACKETRIRRLHSLLLAFDNSMSIVMSP